MIKCRQDVSTIFVGSEVDMLTFFEVIYIKFEVKYQFLDLIPPTHVLLSGWMSKNIFNLNYYDKNSFLFFVKVGEIFYRIFLEWTTCNHPFLTYICVGKPKRRFCLLMSI